MAKWVRSGVLDNGLNDIKNNVVRVALLKSYTAGDSVSTVNANTIAYQSGLTTSNFVITSSGDNRILTASGLGSPTAVGNSQQYDSGTATGGTTTTLVDTSKSWTTNVHAGRAITIISGTGVNQTGTISSNTATTLTISVAWAVAPDATSGYRIADDLHIAFTDGTTTATNVIWVTDETSNQPITSGNTINFPTITYTSNQPT